MALENTGKIEKAKEQYLLALNPNFKDTSYGRAATCNKLAILYFNEGEDSIAIKWLNKAIEFNPDYNRTYYHFGLYYYIRANKNKIIMDYYNSYAFLITALTRSNGSYPKANLLISKIFLELNKKKLAKKYARKAIKQGIKDELIEEAKYIIKVSN
ncbi:MAG: DUF2225 domain-containing protein [Candidatus Dadabacteria bacterium]|nr:DUF2225 domain-containing protein [Candidatus Dadabacteria bacterium]NIQ17126.1 DUF2225 domain-containing protein [Candidatus Dadabacteria bacterium]